MQQIRSHHPHSNPPPLRGCAAIWKLITVVILNPSPVTEPFACHPEQSEGSLSLTQVNSTKGLSFWLKDKLREESNHFN